METKMRNPSKVAADLIKVVPEEAKGNMEYFTKDFSHRSPEMHQKCWEVLQTFLYQIIGPIPTEEWHIKALSIFTDTDIDDIRKFAKELQEKSDKIDNEREEEE